VECVADFNYCRVHGGTSHMSVLEEAVKAKYFGIGKPYGKAEFDKWFADYDVSITRPTFAATLLIQTR
jgi:hypothetical protein